MDIDDKDSDDDGEGDKNHDEEEVLSDQGYDLGGGGNNLFNDQQEHSK